MIWKGKLKSYQYILESFIWSNYTPEVPILKGNK